MTTNVSLARGKNPRTTKRFESPSSAIWGPRRRKGSRFSARSKSAISRSNSVLGSVSSDWSLGDDFAVLNLPPGCRGTICQLILTGYRKGSGIHSRIAGAQNLSTWGLWKVHAYPDHYPIVIL